MSALGDYLRTGPGRAAAAAALAVGVGLAPTGPTAAGIHSMRTVDRAHGGRVPVEPMSEALVEALEALRDELATEVEVCSMAGSFLKDHVDTIAAIAADGRVPARGRLEAMADVADRALSDMADWMDPTGDVPGAVGERLFDAGAAAGSFRRGSPAHETDPERGAAALAKMARALVSELGELEARRRSCMDRLDALAAALADAATATPGGHGDLDAAMVEAIGANVSANAPAP